MSKSRIPRLLASAVCGVVLLVPLSLAHPFGNPRRTGPGTPRFMAGAQAPDAARVLLAQKCANCHSETVAWPFYSRIAPVSWLLERDVIIARSHMNLSRWEQYSSQERADMLGKLAAEVRSGEMPPDRYTAIHRDAKLQPEERELLYNWAKTERKRVRTEALQTRNHSEPGPQPGLLHSERD